MKTTTPATGVQRGRRTLGRPRLVIVGCGDVGLRIVARAHRRFRILALTSSPERVPALRAAGALPIVGNLDDRASLRRLRGLAPWLIHLAPPPNSGRTDPRTRHLLAALAGSARRLVYISTTGVYGDHGGALIDETARPQPANDRAVRRLDAERQMRAAGAAVLRVPGIYAHDRLPLERLRAGTPALRAEDDVVTNHSHADDLARVGLAAIVRGKPTRVYNTVDDSQLKMGEYFDLVADHFLLPRPPRLPRAELRAAVSPMMYSFMTESRRLGNDRLRRELKLRLRWPTVAHALST
ncbi:MAG: NAD-binding protein [Betaproteobacteria bacterium]